MKNYKARYNVFLTLNNLREFDTGAIKNTQNNRIKPIMKDISGYINEFMKYLSSVNNYFMKYPE